MTNSGATFHLPGKKKDEKDILLKSVCKGWDGVGVTINKYVTERTKRFKVTSFSPVTGYFLLLMSYTQKPLQVEVCGIGLLGFRLFRLGFRAAENDHVCTFSSCFIMVNL